MTNSQRFFADISENIAFLRTEINQSGKRGLTDIHKHCENLIKHLLNRVYGYHLINLNGPVTNIEGLDIGDDQTGIAYQVSSERTSAKVDDMLVKVLQYKHFAKYPTVRLFVLGEKQKTYSINTLTEPFFSFDSKTDIIDFDGLLKVIQNLNVHHLQEILNFLQDELPNTFNQLRGDQKLAYAKKSTLLDVAGSQRQSRMSHYQHAVIRLRFIGQSFSTAVLYKELEKFYEGNKRNNLYLFDRPYRKPSTAQQIDFHQQLNNDNSPGYFKEGALRITPNQLIFEIASYTAEHDKLSSLITEVLVLTTLLIFSKQLYRNKKLHVGLDFELATNNKLSLIPQNSHLHLTNYSSWPILNPSPLSFSRIVNDISNETFNSIYKEIIHGFVADSNYGQPFIDLNEHEQNKASEWFRNYFAPMLRDLDDYH